MLDAFLKSRTKLEGVMKTLMRLVLAFIVVLTCNVAASATRTDGTQTVQNIIWKPVHHGFYAYTRNVSGSARV